MRQKADCGNEDYLRVIFHLLYGKIETGNLSFPHWPTLSCQPITLNAELGTEKATISQYGSMM